MSGMVIQFIGDTPIEVIHEALPVLDDSLLLIYSYKAACFSFSTRFFQKCIPLSMSFLLRQTDFNVYHKD